MAGARGASAKPSRCPLVSLPEDSALLLPAPTTQPGLKVARRSRRRRSSRRMDVSDLQRKLARAEGQTESLRGENHGLRGQLREHRVAAAAEIHQLKAAAAADKAAAAADKAAAAAEVAQVKAAAAADKAAAAAEVAQVKAAAAAEVAQVKAAAAAEVAQVKAAAAAEVAQLQEEVAEMKDEVWFSNEIVPELEATLLKREQGQGSSNNSTLEDEVPAQLAAAEAAPAAAAAAAEAPQPAGGGCSDGQGAGAAAAGRDGEGADAAAGDLSSRMGGIVLGPDNNATPGTRTSTGNTVQGPAVGARMPPGMSVDRPPSSGAKAMDA